MRLRLLNNKACPWACGVWKRSYRLPKIQCLIGSAICAAALLGGNNVRAQLLAPDDFFHGGALFYLSNNIPAALDRVTNGLALYPNDPKLKKLEELLKQQNQQQQQQQNQEQKQDEQKKQEQQPAQNQKSEKEKQEEQQKKEAQEKKDEPKPESQQAKKSDEQKEDQKPEDQPQIAGQMTPEEAKKLLDLQKNDEMLMPVGKNEKVRDQAKVVKDW